jgi:hypothetical protein
MGLTVVVAGLTLVMGYNNMDKLSKEAELSEQRQAKQFLAVRNESALALATTLFNSGTNSQPAALYPQVYIPKDLKSEKPRPLNPRNTAKWSSRDNDITVHGTDLDDQASTNADKFSSIQGEKSHHNGNRKDSQLAVRGFKVSNNPISPFLIEAVYLQATTGSRNQALNDSQYLLAEVPVSPPPLTDCNASFWDPNNRKRYPSSGDAIGRELKVKADTLSMNVECNYVVTRLDIYKNGTRIGGTNNTPTPANRISASYSNMVSPITLKAGGGLARYRIVARQADGSDRIFDIGMEQSQEANPEDCEYKCRSNEPAFTGQTYWVHNSWYQQYDPDKWVCYKEHIYMGFDPANNCDGVVVAHRGGGGCFAEDTMILMADGDQKRADQIRPGDQVRNPLSGERIRVKQVVAGPEIAELLEIAIGDRRVKVSQEHPFMTPWGKVAARNLEAGDRILDVDGSFQAVTRVRSIEHDKPVTVWNFVLDGGATESSHLLVGDGLVSGDLVLQQQRHDLNLTRFAFGAE